MPIADRPVSGASIESVWGQQVHDYTFAPTGTVNGGTATSCGTGASTLLDMSSTIDDPGGWLDAANDRVVAPSGSEGLYDLLVTVNLAAGTADDRARVYIQRNGTTVAVGDSAREATFDVPITVANILDVTAGDVFTIRGRGLDATVSLQNLGFWLIRRGAELGA